MCRRGLLFRDVFLLLLTWPYMVRVLLVLPLLGTGRRPNSNMFELLWVLWGS